MLFRDDFGVVRDSHKTIFSDVKQKDQAENWFKTSFNNGCLQSSLFKRKTPEMLYNEPFLPFPRGYDLNGQKIRLKL